MGGSRSHSDKKNGKSYKNKVLRLYNSPLLGGARDMNFLNAIGPSAPLTKKQKVYTTSNVCLKTSPSAHYLTKHKQEAEHKKK